jgi:hypothetical protein
MHFINLQLHNATSPKGTGTSKSMGTTSCVECKDLNKRLISLEKEMRIVKLNNKYLVKRNLQVRIDTTRQKAADNLPVPVFASLTVYLLHIQTKDENPYNL